MHEIKKHRNLTAVTINLGSKISNAVPNVKNLFNPVNFMIFFQIWFKLLCNTPFNLIYEIKGSVTIKIT